MIACEKEEEEEEENILLTQCTAYEEGILTCIDIRLVFQITNVLGTCRVAHFLI